MSAFRPYIALFDPEKLHIQKTPCLRKSYNALFDLQKVPIAPFSRAILGVYYLFSIS
ncbi:conserved hypothetical protein [delta proteobacterium NaphS2]|nr:conserved hypothetical protein [delta proteobacterium NaphS2]